MRTDFYSGFEGYPSITFSIEGDNTNKIEIWDGYFGDIMELVKPNTQGNWDGLALYYHTATGWYDVDNWPLDNIELAMAQLSSLEIKPENKEILEELKSSIVSLFKKALQQNKRVLIDYD